jgi:triphosphoribosyl-dephospho-CoA synthase
MDYRHFLEAANAIGKSIERSIDLPLGPMVEECTRSMIDAVGVNTSLGTILLLAPLIQCQRRWGKCFEQELLGGAWTGERVKEFLRETNARDCDLIFRAIAASKPGGLGSSETHDVLGPAPDSVLSAMQVAAKRDDIALQYSNGFLEVASYARTLRSPEFIIMPLKEAIRRLQVVILADRVDSLIVRKCGLPVGLEVQSRAKLVLHSSPYGSDGFEFQWEALDRYLRQDGHRRNPGTTADLIAAALYVANPIR